MTKYRIIEEVHYVVDAEDEYAAGEIITGPKRDDFFVELANREIEEVDDGMPMAPEEYVTAKGVRCPSCQSKHILSDHVSAYGCGAHEFCHCFSCEATWDNIYVLETYVNLQVKRKD